MTYKRVLPRDAFNESKLLKCVGKLTLLIEDKMAKGWHYHYDDEPFCIVQDKNDGSISVANITFWYKKKQVTISTGLNSKEAWPAIMTLGDNSYYIFQEDGSLMPLGV